MGPASHEKLLVGCADLKTTWNNCARTAVEFNTCSYICTWCLLKYDHDASDSDAGGGGFANSNDAR